MMTASVPTRTSWPAKLMLFGEYSILSGSPALSIPYHHFRASFQYADNAGATRQAREARLQLHTFYEFLSRKKPFQDILDLPQLKADLSQGLYLESDIPVRYGAGSSGAVVAAVYQTYRKEKWPKSADSEVLPDVQKDLAGMEAFFHGTSSGFDPLVILLEKPVLTEGGILSFPFPDQTWLGDDAGFFLIDSGIQAGTKSFVKDYLQHFTPPGKKSTAGNSMSHTTRLCIHALIDKDLGTFENQFYTLSSLQHQYFQPMIPNLVRILWEQGLRSRTFSLKLCGSGGGGFFLGITSHLNNTLALLNSHSQIARRL